MKKWINLSRVYTNKDQSLPMTDNFKGFPMLHTRALVPSLLLASTLAISHANAQDLYDTAVLRTFAFTFTQTNWETLLRNNYASQTNLLCSLTVDGITYNNVGVRIRGNTSYTALPAGSQKFSLNIDMNIVDTSQSIYGHSSLNLNNGFHDPTFCREVLYNNFVAEFMPNPRANHALVTINGQNWGVYINVQNFSKNMLSSHFPDTSGLRIKCANNPNGPGLRYNGAAISGYSTAYEIKETGGFADPWAPHILVCNTLSNAATTNWMSTIDPIVAVDPSIWSVVFENIMTDDDSYINKGADFMTYRNPTDGRTHIMQTDANETFTQSSWVINRNWSNTTSRPFLNRILAVPELRQRYMAHYRTAKQDLSWANYFEPRATAMRALIEPHVNTDPKKLYTFAQFQSNFATSVTLGCSGPCGGTVPGLQQFVTDRATYLNTQAELVANGPTITALTASDASPEPNSPVTISASVAPNGSPVARVDLYYRPNPTGTYQRVQMNSSGMNQYSVVLPVSGSPGQRVSYYVAATASNTFSSMSFLPTHTEWDPQLLTYTFGATGGMRITEWMYSGLGGEFIEFTNISGQPIDMTGWAYNDDRALVGAFDLSAFGMVQPGESVILTEANPATFRTNWNVPATTKIIGNLGAVGTGGNNLSRNDEINLYDANDQLADRLPYGDQTYPGTIRTQNFTGQATCEFIGQDSATGWIRSVVSDQFGSVLSLAGDVGTPGSYNQTCTVDCDFLDFNRDGLFPDTQDVDDFLAVFSGAPCSNDPNCGDIDFNNDGLFPDTQDINALLSVFSGGPCS
jgi:hypothetical protein